jgi:hypothetical protein
VHRNKFIAVILLSISFLSTSTILARAADMPTLQWETGREQTVTLGGNTSELLWNVSLTKNGKSYGTFTRSSKNSSGFYVYSIEISDNFKLGKYEIVASGPNNPPTLVSYVNILKNNSYNLLQDPKSMGLLATVVFTLLNFIGLKNIDLQDSATDDTNLGSINSDHIGGQMSGIGVIDRLNIGKSKLLKTLDLLRHNLTFDVSNHSPVATRVLSDSSYLQALLGPFFLLLPIASTVVGYLAGKENSFSVSVVPTSVVLISILIGIAIFDALSGFLGFATYLIYTLMHNQVSDFISIRTLMGLGILFVSPLLIAGNVRPVRRPSKEFKFSERVGDLILSPVFGGWAVKGMLVALNAFSHTKNYITVHSGKIALLAGALILVRYLLEDLAGKLAPQRLEFLVPINLKSQTNKHFYYALLSKLLVFIFFMYGFFGFSWQLLIAIVFLSLPPLLSRFGKSFPNSTWIFQTMPSGLPGLVFMAFFGFYFSKWINTWPILSTDRSKSIFIYAGIPGFMLNMLKLFGRKPKAGDVKWYCRDNYKILYTTMAPVFIALSILITIGVIP